jgi:hypothetical protein
MSSSRTKLSRSQAGVLGWQASKEARELLQKNRIDAYLENPNYCLYCHSAIVLKPGEPLFAVRIRKFCKSSCSASYHNTGKSRSKSLQKYCLTCGSPVKPRNIYCNDACFRKSYPKPKTHRLIRRDIIKNRGAKCEKCGWSEVNPFTKTVPIVLNHIDGNSENFEDSNLELLCPNCDSLTATYKGLNRGNGRATRRKRYNSGKSY